MEANENNPGKSNTFNNIQFEKNVITQDNNSISDSIKISNSTDNWNH